MNSPPKPSPAYPLLLASVAALGGFLFGFDSGVINGAVHAVGLAFGTNSVETGFVVASALVGCAIGAFAAGAVAERVGRRPAMLWTAVVFVLSAVATGAANSAFVFIAARTLGGVAIGGASILAPMYISEIAPAGLRGRLSSLQQLAIVLGLFFSYLSNDLIASAAEGASKPFWLGLPAWRWMFWVEVVPSVGFLAGAMLIPESPRYLVATGKIDEARAIFGRIGGAGRAAEELVAEVRASLKGEHKPRLSDLFDRAASGARRVAPIVWIGVGLAAFQQFVGINVIFYYGEVLWTASGATSAAALKINLLTGGVNILATVIAIALIDKVGRRPLLLAGSLGMVITLGLLAFTFSRAAIDPATHKPVLSHNDAVFGISCVLLYIIAFGTSWGPAVWVLLGEIFPNRLRGAALAVSGASNWIANFAVTASFPPLLKYAGLGPAYGLYATAALVSGVFVFLLVRETKGKTLEEMSAAPLR